MGQGELDYAPSLDGAEPQQEALHVITQYIRRSWTGLCALVSSGSYLAFHS